MVIWVEFCSHSLLSFLFYVFTSVQLINFSKYFLFSAEDKLQQMTGPSAWDQWMLWKGCTDDHHNRRAVKTELEKMLGSSQVKFGTLL